MKHKQSLFESYCAKAAVLFAWKSQQNTTMKLRRAGILGIVCTKAVLPST